MEMKNKIFLLFKFTYVYSLFSCQPKFLCIEKLGLLYEILLLDKNSNNSD